ncbi:MAG: hypothetical protein JO122_13600 [Acetobacteraceae bacterium]|nr:hypothetical protein [Acetobacteraceae bacterium]
MGGLSRPVELLQIIEQLHLVGVQPETGSLARFADFSGKPDQFQCGGVWDAPLLHE